MVRSAGQAARTIAIGIVESIEAAESIADEWHDLACHSVDAGPFGYPDVALNWWRALGKGHLHIVTARSADGQLVGLAPLYCRARGPVAVMGFLGTGVGAVGSFLQQPGLKADVVTLMLEEALSDRRTVLDLQNFRYGAPGINELRRNPDLRTRAELQDECPVISLAGIATIGEFLASPDRSGLRKKLAKAGRSLADHDVAYRHATDRDDVMATWSSIQPLYDRAEADYPRQHFGRGANSRFFEPMLRSMAERRQASITSVWIDGNPAAFDVFLWTGDTAHAVLGRFDPDLAGFSPGQLLLQFGVQEAIAARVEDIDLQLGDDLYKRRWSTQSYDTVHVRSAASRTFTLADSVLKGVDAAFELRSRLR
ncbi:MAG: GNAT family N-acetyltransferase [Acidimicrobiales bacterium]|nr:GNAT family N-acetyltransferase [Acidimicrobiales bacterium]